MMYLFKIIPGHRFILQYCSKFNFFLEILCQSLSFHILKTEKKHQKA